MGEDLAGIGACNIQDPAMMSGEPQVDQALPVADNNMKSSEDDTES